MTELIYKNCYNKLHEGAVAKRFGSFTIYWPYIDSTEKKYPRLQFKLDASDMGGIIKDDVLNSSMMKTQIEKLLYAVLWKQGDLSKIKHIIEGVENKGSISDKKSGMIFYQFGRHLSNPIEPIIDVNVLYAYAHYRGDITALTTNGISTAKKGNDLAKDYIEWFKDVTEDEVDHKFMVDRIMFAVGKHIKSENKYS